MLVKVLGGVDVLCGIVLLLLALKTHPVFQILLICAGLLFLKGMFIFTGDILSILDWACASLFILSIFFAVPVFLLWIAAFAMFGKGFVSFL